MRPKPSFVQVTLFVWLLTVVALVGCNSSPTDDEPLFGTWVVDPGIFVGSLSLKVAFMPDGTCLRYVPPDSPEPYEECRFTIEEKWIDDAGNVYYHLPTKLSPAPFDESSVGPTWYVAVKIDSTGDVMEVVSSKEDYAEEVSPAARGNYKMYRRQP